MSSPKSPYEGDEFDHIIAHTMSCTLEKEDVSAMAYEELRFGSLHEVIKGDVLEYLGQGKGCLEQDKKALIEGFGPCLERGKENEAKCLKRGKENEAKWLE